MSSWLGLLVGAYRGVDEVYVRRTDSSACNDEVVPTAHSSHGFDDVVFIVRDDFYAFELDA